MTPEPVSAVVALAEVALDTTVEATSPVHGGDVATSFRLDLADGTTVFAKAHVAAPDGFFTTEALGLAWLRDTGTIAVPAVLALSDDPAALVLEWIDEAGRHHADEAAFGRSLAELHLAGAPCFGRADRRTTGSRGLPNEPCDDWATFYASQRLLPLAQLGRDTATLAAETIAMTERVAARLEQLDVPHEPPARLHGDLWAGNRLVDRRGTSWLIDPACHGGHREFDLAMMALFGGFDEACFAAYDEVHPLAAGWRDRIPLHQLAPLLVHAIKFSGSYHAAVDAALGRYC